MKSTRLQPVGQIELTELGARGDRAFCVIDARGRMVNAKRIALLQTVRSRIDDGRLELTFADGSSAAGSIEYGETLPIKFFSHACDARLLVGPWSQALSDTFGVPLRLVEPVVGVDRGRAGGVTLIARGSVDHLARVADEESIDVRRFRMLVEVDGIGPHEEDAWVGEAVRIGPALVAMRGNVGRCLITGLDPDTGVPTLPTLDLLGSYRGDVRTTEPIPFGIYGEVLETGPVSVGDPVVVEGPTR